MGSSPYDFGFFLTGCFVLSTVLQTALWMAQHTGKTRTGLSVPASESYLGLYIGSDLCPLVRVPIQTLHAQEPHVPRVWEAKRPCGTWERKTSVAQYRYGEREVYGGELQTHTQTHTHAHNTTNRGACWHGKLRMETYMLECREKNSRKANTLQTMAEKKGPE